MAYLLFSHKSYIELPPHDLREANYNQSNFFAPHSTWPRLVGYSHRGKYLIPLCLFYTLWHHNNLGVHDSTCHTKDVLRQTLCRKSHDTCKKLSWWSINTKKSSNYFGKDCHVIIFRLSTSWVLLYSNNLYNFHIQMLFRSNDCEIYLVRELNSWPWAKSGTLITSVALTHTSWGQDVNAWRVFHLSLSKSFWRLFHR